jgi:hypothetical protein
LFIRIRYHIPWPYKRIAWNARKPKQTIHVRNKWIPKILNNSKEGFPILSLQNIWRSWYAMLIAAKKHELENTMCTNTTSSQHQIPRFVRVPRDIVQPSPLICYSWSILERNDKHTLYLHWIQNRIRWIKNLQFI